MVRHYNKPLLKGYIRISVGTPQQTETLMTALTAIDDSLWSGQVIKISLELPKNNLPSNTRNIIWAFYFPQLFFFHVSIRISLMLEAPSSTLKTCFKSKMPKRLFVLLNKQSAIQEAKERGNCQLITILLCVDKGVKWIRTLHFYCFLERTNTPSNSKVIHFRCHKSNPSVWVQTPGEKLEQIRHGLGLVNCLSSQNQIELMLVKKGWTATPVATEKSGESMTSPLKGGCRRVDVFCNTWMRHPL